jgi:hypothetical protein
MRASMLAARSVVAGVYPPEQGGDCENAWAIGLRSFPEQSRRARGIDRRKLDAGAARLDQFTHAGAPMLHERCAWHGIWRRLLRRAIETLSTERETVPRAFLQPLGLVHPARTDLLTGRVGESRIGATRCSGPRPRTAPSSPANQRAIPSSEVSPERHFIGRGLVIGKKPA